MSKIFGLALGILAAIGGFVDIGDLVFNTAAGATFDYQLAWVIPVGVLGISTNKMPASVQRSSSRTGNSGSISSQSSASRSPAAIENLLV